MRGRTALLAAAVLSAGLAAPANPPVTREALAALEKKFDRRIESHHPTDPLYLLGTTRGVYLSGYGVVFTSELNLVAAAVVTPFRPAFTPEQIEQLRLKKLARLAELKEMMRAMMVDSATALEAVPPEQRIAVGVTLFRFSWEDSRGLPAQVLMEARRQALLDFEAGRLAGPGLDAAIRVQEF
jgi:hypothetical protein